MLPTFSIGPLAVPVYPLMWGLGALAAGMLGFHNLVVYGESPRRAAPWMIGLFGGGLLSGFLLFRLVDLVRLLNPAANLEWLERVSLVIALGGGMLAAYLLRSLLSLPLSRAMDGIALPMPMLTILGRLGCLAAGCCYGKATTSWLGMFMPGRDGEWALRYPAQLIASASSVLVFWLLLALERWRNRRLLEGGEADLRPGNPGGVRNPFAMIHPPSDGLVFWAALALFCVQRFLQDFIQEDVHAVLGPLTWIQAALLLAGPLAAAKFIQKARRLAEPARIGVPIMPAAPRDQAASPAEEMHAAVR